MQRSAIWPLLKVRCFTENIRVAGADPENRAFVQWLQDLFYYREMYGWVTPFIMMPVTTSVADFYREIYPDILL